jgi:hypothetical protein
MKLDFKTIVIAGLFAFMVFYITKCNSDKQTEELRAELHKNEIKMDTLKKISDTQYEKLVADTVTKKDMAKIIKDLEMEVKNPKIITRIEYKQRDVEKAMDNVIVENDSVHIEDYYPSKEKHTLKYTGGISLVSKQGKGKFEFKPQKLDLLISETDKGMWKATLKTDNEFVEVNSLDVHTLPVAEQKIKNWKYFGGAKYNTTSDKTTQSYEILGGFRYKKLNVLGSVNTNSQLGVGLMFDF